jgi:hypothetical protein
MLYKAAPVRAVGHKIASDRAAYPRVSAMLTLRYAVDRHVPQLRETPRLLRRGARDAQAEVSVRLAEGADPDTLLASAKAYLGALNKLMVRQARGRPEAMVVGGQRVHSTDTI